MNTQSISESRQQMHKLAQELIEKRSNLWALRDELVQLQPYSTDQPLESLVRQFCQELIDYISLEHFGVFHHLLNGTEKDVGIIGLAEEIYPGMAEITDAALAFNDKCEAFTEEELVRELPGELSLLEDELAMRVELEDRLIARMVS